MVKTILIVFLFFGVCFSQYADRKVVTTKDSLKVVVVSNEASLKIDELTGAVATLNYEHHEIHEGSHFFYYESDNDVDAGETLIVMITAPASPKTIHMIIGVESGLSASVSMYEGSAKTDSILRTAGNSNRNSSTTATAKISLPTKSGSKGTLAATKYLGLTSGTGTNTRYSAGSTGREEEFILKYGTKYYLEAVSLADNNTISVALLWYEH